MMFPNWFLLLGLGFFFFHLKPRNVGQNKDFSTADNFGICIQTRKHKRFLTQERALCGTQDFQEELQQATKLDLQTGRPSEMSRERI